MSRRYIGGTITRNPVAPTGPYSNSTASGIWGLNDAANFVKQGIWPTAGNINPDYFIENLFSTYLYTGNGSTQTITNGINLSTKGGLVWIKDRQATWDHLLIDSARGNNNALFSNRTYASTAGFAVSLTTSGFSLTGGDNISNAARNYVSWTFAERQKFFDIVTYTGNGTNPRNISHNLGSVPGCIIVKSTSAVGNWSVYHRGVSPINSNTLSLQSTNPAGDGGQDLWGNGATVVVPTSTVFTVSNSLNTNGTTYVAYLFAHDAGGFGLTGNDNVISCGSFTTNGSGDATVNLGYEPQWILYKSTAAGAYDNDWHLVDNMRGWSNDGTYGKARRLFANTVGVESNSGSGFCTSTGFYYTNQSFVNNYIYIAIRRGPMKVPTVASSVFSLAKVDSTLGGGISMENGDMALYFRDRFNGSNSAEFFDRIRGFPQLGTNSPANRISSPGTLAEEAIGAYVTTTFFGSSYYNCPFQDSNNIMRAGFSGNGLALTGQVVYGFRRAPGFFDEVCYTGTDVVRTVAHNLGVVPELMIVKNRTTAGYGWITYSATLGATKAVQLNTSTPEGSSTQYWNNTAPTSSVFTVGTSASTNESPSNLVAYLFATCAGVSKVGSYTGTATTLQVNCGFTAGARFVLIKRTDVSADWYVWDTARGIISGNDPYLLMNSTAAEVTNTDYIDPYSAGFELSSVAPAALNANGGTYIFLAIA